MRPPGKIYYPTILQAIHLLILYLFIQTVVDFPLALIDYFNDTEYLYHPVKKVLLNAGSTLFILIYGIRRSGTGIKSIFPMKFFNPIVILPVALFFIGAHNFLEYINRWVDKMIPAPAWFWELFSKIFENDYGFWGAFFKVAIVAPVIEELIFRGILLQGLRKNYHPATAVIVSALLFSLYHLNPWQMPATLLLGILLGWLMLRTNNILLAIIGHSLNNALVLLTVTYWPVISENAFFLLSTQKKLSLSGLLVILAVLLIYLLTIKWTNIRNVKSGTEHH